MADTDPAPHPARSSPMKALHDVRGRHKPLRDTHKEVREALTPLQQTAVFITERVGTMGFFLLILAWTVIWLGLNFFSPWKFDPPMGFVFYLFISNVIQILLMPLIMVGQNLQGAHSEARAQHDLEVNVKAEQEIEVILVHLEHQNALLMQMVEKLGVDVRETLGKT
jgi:uncharacterized membrane protein